MAFRVVAFFMLAIGLCVNAICSDKMRVEILRTNENASCTLGDMGVNDSSLGVKTLELPWRDNQGDISRIPAGQYDAILRYDHSDAWRIELQNVSGRGNIQIHVGNWPSNTNGCILVGLTSNGCSLKDSVAAYRRLRAAFYGSENPVSTPNKNIIVIVRDRSR